MEIEHICNLLKQLWHGAWVLLELFCYSSHYFHKDAGQLLPRACNLLKSNLFTEIIEDHLANRSKESIDQLAARVRVGFGIQYFKALLLNLWFFFKGIQKMNWWKHLLKKKKKTVSWLFSNWNHGSMRSSSYFSCKCANQHASRLY